MLSATVETTAMCSACGDPIQRPRDGMDDGDGRIHLTCAVSRTRRESWLHERYAMRSGLRRAFAGLLGRERVEPIIEPIGDDERKPSQVFTALATLSSLLKTPDTHINAVWVGAAEASLKSCQARLRLFLGRKP